MVVLGIDVNMDAVELFDNVANGEGCKISQSTASLLKVACCQWFLSEAGSNMVNVFGPTLLNMRPLLTFLVIAETTLSRSKST